MAYPSNSVARDELDSIIQRVERLGKVRSDAAKDISSVYAEAKGRGFDVKALKIVVRRREQDPDDRAELEALVDLYESALGSRRYDDEAPASRAPAPARTREIIEEFGTLASFVPYDAFDHETGEILDPDQLHRNVPVEAADEDSTPSSADAHSPEGDTQSTAALMEVRQISSAEPGQPPMRAAGTQAPPVDTPVASALSGETEQSGLVSPGLNDACRAALNLRPHCLAAKANTLSKCGGTDRTHCTDCRRAHADAEGFAA